MVAYMKTLLTLVLVFLFPNLLPAQQVWSLERCIDHAMTHNLTIKQHDLIERQAQNETKQSYASLFPSLNAISNQGYNYGRTVDRFTNEFATERVAFQDMYVWGEVTLFSGFQHINNIRLNLARNTAFRYDTEKMQNDIVLSIASAYLQILYFEDMVEIGMQQLDVIRQQLERTKILLERGSIARGELLEIEAQEAQEELNVLNASNNLESSYLELIHLLDLDPGEPFEILRPDLEVDETFVLYEPDLVLEKALDSEPSVLAARSRIEMAEKGLAISRGEMSPSISFATYIGTGYSGAAQRPVGQFATGEYTEIGRTISNEAVVREIMMPILEDIPYRDQVSDNFNRVLQLRVQVPLFNRFQTRTRIQNARLDLENARLGLEMTKNTLSKTVQEAHADAVAAYKKYLATLKSQKAFDESFVYAEQRFNQGMISSLEYNEAKTRLASSEVDVLQSKYEFVFKARILEFYQGMGFSL